MSSSVGLNMLVVVGYHQVDLWDLSNSSSLRKFIFVEVTIMAELVRDFLVQTKNSIKNSIKNEVLISPCMTLLLAQLYDGSRVEITHILSEFFSLDIFPWILKITWPLELCNLCLNSTARGIPGNCYPRQPITNLSLSMIIVSINLLCVTMSIRLSSVVIININ